MSGNSSRMKQSKKTNEHPLEWASNHKSNLFYKLHINIVKMERIATLRNRKKAEWI